MICVTGSEDTPDALRERQRAARDADLHELRLDLLDDPTIPVTALAERPLSTLVVTCRSGRQGGGFCGEESLRLSLLRSAADAGVGFIDLESDVLGADADRILDAAAAGSTRVIRSFHGYQPMSPREIEAAMEELRSLRGHVLKLAVAIEDAADLEVLFRLGTVRDRPVVLIALGATGVLSRLCYRRFKSAWTFVAGDPARSTAQGQISWSQALEWGLLSGTDPAPIALLGGAQVHGSPGPRVYNRLFAQLESPHVYVPVETQRLEQTWDLLRRLGVCGASVTMPHKEAAVSLVDEVDTSMGSINTIWCSRGRFKATSTDGEGAICALEPAIAIRGARALVLGAGGAARSVAASLVEHGASVSLWNRSPERSRRLAGDLETISGGATVELAKEIRPERYDVLVNATSVGLHGEGCLVEDWKTLKGVVVLDCVAQPEETPLLQITRRAGGVAVSGREMWLHQGAAQVSLWLGRRFRGDDLRQFLE